MSTPLTPGERASIRRNHTEEDGACSTCWYGAIAEYRTAGWPCHLIRLLDERKDWERLGEEQYNEMAAAERRAVEAEAQVKELIIHAGRLRAALEGIARREPREEEGRPGRGGSYCDRCVASSDEAKAALEGAAHDS